MESQEVDCRFAGLKRRHGAGKIGTEKFDAQRRQLMMQIRM